MPFIFTCVYLHVFYAEEYLEAILKALLKKEEKDGDEYGRVGDSNIQSRESGKEISSSDKPSISQPQIHVQPPEGDEQNHDIAKGADARREFSSQDHSSGYGTTDDVKVQVGVSAQEKIPDIGEKDTQNNEKAVTLEGSTRRKEDGTYSDSNADRIAEDREINKESTQAVSKNIQDTLSKPETQQDVPSLDTDDITGEEGGKTEPAMVAESFVENRESGAGTEQGEVFYILNSYFQFTSSI